MQREPHKLGRPPLAPILAASGEVIYHVLCIDEECRSVRQSAEARVVELHLLSIQSQPSLNKGHDRPWGEQDAISAETKVWEDGRL